MALWGYPQSTLSSPRGKVFPLQPRSISRCTPAILKEKQDEPIVLFFAF